MFRVVGSVRVSLTKFVCYLRIPFIKAMFVSVEPEMFENLERP